jgi:predicted enzyme related to lactoylglutathione lyase
MAAIFRNIGEELFAAWCQTSFSQEQPMIQRLSHMNVYVLDQQRAHAFYVDKLGFEVRTDITLGNGFRWLTVGPKGQPDLELALMAVMSGPFLSKEDAEVLRGLVARGGGSSGVFETADCQKTYDELKSRGVEFTGPPEQRPYGIETLLKDDSGNWFSLVQRPK